jgi:hypothetical protein
MFDPESLLIQLKNVTSRGLGYGCTFLVRWAVFAKLAYI